MEKRNLSTIEVAQAVVAALELTNSQTDDIQSMCEVFLHGQELHKFITVFEDESSVRLTGGTVFKQNGFN